MPIDDLSRPYFYFEWIQDDKDPSFFISDYKYLIKMIKIFNPKEQYIVESYFLKYPFIEHEYHFIGLNDIDRIHLDDVYHPVMCRNR